jgi:hypothetical protein
VKGDEEQVDPKALTKSQRFDLYVGGVVRRWILASVLMVALFVMVTTLNAIWSPLALAMPAAAAVIVIVIVARAIREGYVSAGK